MGKIYRITNLINGKCYIGQTIGSLDNYWGSGSIITKAIDKYGKHNFKKELIEEVPDEKLDEREIYWIREYNSKKPNGYNITDGGNGMRGYKHEEETKIKIGKAQLGRKRPCSEEAKRKIGEANRRKFRTDFTKHKISETSKKYWTEEKRKEQSEKLMNLPPRSKETREKLSLAGRGRFFTQEWRDNLSKAARKKVLTEETKRKLSETLKGRTFSEEHKRKISESVKRTKSKHGNNLQ